MMLIDKQCKSYTKSAIESSSQAVIKTFLQQKRTFFINQFLNDVRQSKGKKNIKIKVLVAFVAQLHHALRDLERPASEKLVMNLMKFQHFGIEPDRLLGRVFRSLILHFIDEYRNDPLLFAHLHQLSRYFSLIIACLLEKMALEYQRPLEAVSIAHHEMEAYVAAHRHLKLFAHYKGVPVLFKGDIEGFEEMLVLRIPKDKGIVAEWEGRLLAVEETADAKGVLMRVRRVEFLATHALVYADGFSWVDNYIHRRKSVRVLVDERIKVRIKAAKTFLELELFDLSTGGICLEGSSDKGLPAQGLVEVELELPFGKDSRRLQVTGVLRYISQAGEVRRRYHIALQIDGKKEEILANYVAMLQTKRLQEIKELAQRR